MRGNLPTILLVLSIFSIIAIQVTYGSEPFVLKLDKNAPLPSLQDLESGDISLGDLLPDSSDFVIFRIEI